MSADIIAIVCAALTMQDEAGAKQILRSRLPISKGAIGPRKYSKEDMLACSNATASSAATRARS